MAVEAVLAAVEVGDVRVAQEAVQQEWVVDGGKIVIIVPKVVLAVDLIPEDLAERVVEEQDL